MSLTLIATALRTAKNHKLDGIDLMLLDYILTQKKQRGEVTIMEAIKGSKIASQATAHARIKRLVDRKLLVKVNNSTNLRLKTLEDGPELVMLLLELT